MRVVAHALFCICGWETNVGLAAWAAAHSRGAAGRQGNQQAKVGSAVHGGGITLGIHDEAHRQAFLEGANVFLRAVELLFVRLG